MSFLQTDFHCVRVEPSFREVVNWEIDAVVCSQ